MVGLGNEALALTFFSSIFSLRNSLDFELGKAFQKAEIMLQVEDTALWTGVSGSRLKVSRSLFHLKKHSLPSKDPLQLLQWEQTSKRETLHRAPPQKNNPESKTWCSQRSTSESLSLAFIVSQNSLWPDDSLAPEGNLSHSVLAEWECSAELHTEWKHKQQSAFRQKNPLLHWGWGEKAAGWLCGTQGNKQRQ